MGLKQEITFGHSVSLTYSRLTNFYSVLFQTIYGPKKELVWVYLERVNIEKPPYNEKGGAWLRFLKELKYYFYCEGKIIFLNLY